MWLRLPASAMIHLTWRRSSFSPLISAPAKPRSQRSQRRPTFICEHWRGPPQLATAQTGGRKERVLNKEIAKISEDGVRLANPPCILRTEAHLIEFLDNLSLL